MLTTATSAHDGNTQTDISTVSADFYFRKLMCCFLKSKWRIPEPTTGGPFFLTTVRGQALIVKGPTNDV